MEKTTSFKQIYRKIGRAVTDYAMIEDGDRIMVALSGGKDSFTLLDTLRRLQKRAPVKFTLFASTVHPGFPGFKTERIEEWLKVNKYDYHIETSNIYEEVFIDPKKASDGCFYCSRQRRSVLYRIADSNGCNKIALGHHQDDFIETVFLSMMYNGIIETMLPVFATESGKIKVIRPLMYVEEKDIITYAISGNFPVTCCACPLCKNGNLRRKKVKDILGKLEKEDRGIKGSIFRSLSNFNGPHMLDMRYNEKLKNQAIRIITE